MSKQVYIYNKCSTYGITYACHNFILQMAFSYIWMQVVPRAFTKTGVAQVQAVQNVLLGRKRSVVLYISGNCRHGVFSNSIKKHPLGSVHIVGSTSTRQPTPAVAQLLNDTQSITTFMRVLTNTNEIF